jgi:hypothetical protein
MRASRAVSLSVLTLGLTIGGISAAAADAVDTNSTVTTTNGTTSSYEYATDDSHGSGSITTSADGVTADQHEIGVSPDGTAFDHSSTLWVNAHGVGHSSTDARGDRDKCKHHDEDGWQGEGRWFNDDRDHHGLIPDLVDDLL